MPSLRTGSRPHAANESLNLRPQDVAQHGGGRVCGVAAPVQCEAALGPPPAQLLRLLWQVKQPCACCPVAWRLQTHTVSGGFYDPNPCPSPPSRRTSCSKIPGNPTLPALPTAGMDVYSLHSSGGPKERAVFGSAACPQMLRAVRTLCAGVALLLNGAWTYPSSPHRGKPQLPRWWEYLQRAGAG